jgi:hypothetical protein
LGFRIIWGGGALGISKDDPDLLIHFWNTYSKPPAQWCHRRCHLASESLLVYLQCPNYTVIVQPDIEGILG